MTNKLVCTNYDIRRQRGQPVLIRVDFTLRINPSDTEDIAESLKQIELLLSGPIDLVRSDDTKPRCPWCGALHDADDKQCKSCGGSL